MTNILIRAVRKVRRSDWIDALRAELEQNSVESERQLGLLQEQLGLLQEQHGLLQDQHRLQLEQLAQQEKNFADLTNSRDAEISLLKQSLTERRDVAEDLVRRLDAVQNELDGANERVRAIASDRDAQNAALADLTREIAAARHERDQALAEAFRQSESVGRLASSFETLSERAASDLSSCRSELASARSEADTLRGENRHRGAELEETAGRLFQLEADLAQARERVASLEEAAASADVRFEALALERDSLLAECARLGASEMALIAEKREVARMALEAEQESARRSKEQTRESSLIDPRLQTIRIMRESGARQRLLQQLLLDPHTGAPDRRAIFTLHKTASSFISNLMGYLAEMLNLPIHSPNGTGAEYINDEINIRTNMHSVEGRSGLFGPFRGYVDFPPSTFSRTIVILRDPRDILVSMYFSWAYSHPVDDGRLSLVNASGELFNPSQETKDRWKADGPDEFVLEFAGFVEKNLRAYFDRIVQQPGTTVLLYEHFIANQAEWLRRLLSGLGANGADLEWLLPSIVENFAMEFKPRTEDKQAHIRQMLPGDHKRKLRHETITLLNRKFSFYFEAIEKLNQLPGSSSREAGHEVQTPAGATPGKSSVRSIGSV